MKSDPSRPGSRLRQALPIAVVLAAGIALAMYIVGTSPSPASGEHDDEPHAEAGDHADAAHGEPGATAAKKGPHGGRLFSQGDYGLEILIYAAGAEPRFRIYTYRGNQPVVPAQGDVAVTLERLGRKAQTIAFTAQGDYLEGDAVVQEPHSFSVTISARSSGQSHQFKYEQVEARVTMSDEQLKNNGVQVATVAPARIKTVLQLQGEVRLNEDRTVRVLPRLTGLVESVAANAGDNVRRGQVLAVVSSQALADQRSEWLAAHKRVGLARTTFERERKLWEAKISAQQDYLQAGQALQEAEIAEQSARQKLASIGVSVSTTGSPSQAAIGNLTRYEIRSPIDGVITDKKIATGEVIKDDANIFVVADMSTVWVEMTVYAKDVNTVRVGQPAIVNATSFEARAEGKVTYVGALVGEQTRAANARLVLPNPSGSWRPGLPVSVELTAEEVEVPLAISVDAVQTLGTGPAVFGRYGNHFEARPVKLGRSDGKTVEVLGGLEPGERYAGRNSYLVKADIGKSAASHEH